MKRLTKIAAILTAAVLMLGSALTTFAAPSVTTSAVAATATDVTAVAATTADGTVVTVTAVANPEATYTSAQTSAVAVLGDTTATVSKVFELTANITGPTNITIKVPGITAGQKVAVLHQLSDGTWETRPVVEVTNGAVTATFDSLSPVAVVTYGTSPKTGETLPVAGIICVIALCGAALSVKKFAL